MSDKQLKAKYTEYKKKLHTCSPVDYQVTKDVMNHYYNRMMKRGIV